jgi:hypothetical protein
MREGFKALLLPHKTPVITHLNHMGDAVILAYKAAPRFKGRPNHIAPRCALEAAIQSLYIRILFSADRRSSGSAPSGVCLSALGEGGLQPRAIQTSAPLARHPPNHSNPVSSSTPYNHLVLSRARHSSGTSTHRLAVQEKSSGKSKEVWIFGLVSLREPPHNDN